MAAGYHLTTFLYGLYGGRRKLPALPSQEAPKGSGSWLLGAAEGPVTLGGEIQARQIDATTCGSASIVLAKACDPVSAEASELAASDENARGSVFNRLQLETKAKTNRRRGVVRWPAAWGTPPWGAAAVMGFAGHQYFDRMVVDTSLPQSTRVLTHAAQCAELGYPVLLYVGGDTKMGWSTAVPRHVVVLHSPPQGSPVNADEPYSNQEVSDEQALTERDAHLDHVSPLNDIEIEMERKLREMEKRIQAKLEAAKAAHEELEYNPALLVYEPSSGVNTEVTLHDLIERQVDPQAFGGWPHIMWAVMPRP